MKFDEKLLDYWGGDADNLVEKIFMHLYKELPNVYSVNFTIDVDVIIKRLRRKYELTEADFIIKNEEACKDDWLKVNYAASDYLIRIDQGLLLYLSSLKSEIYYSHDLDFSKVKELVRSLKSRRRAKRDVRRSFFLLKSDGGNFALEKVEMPETDITLEEFFNDDIVEFHNRLVSFLKDSKARGIALIHGKHGSGKTAYLKYLIANTDIKFILVPRSLHASFDSVKLYTYLRDFKDAVLVLEDCDQLLSGMAKYNPLLGFLRNAEGLLADNYAYKIICTTSLAEYQINPEYIRKAANILHYNMRDLAAEKANRLRKKLGISGKLHHPAVLEDVINPAAGAFRSKKLGFNS